MSRRKIAKIRAKVFLSYFDYAKVIPFILSQILCNSRWSPQHRSPPKAKPGVILKARGVLGVDWLNSGVSFSNHFPWSEVVVFRRDSRFNLDLYRSQLAQTLVFTLALWHWGNTGGTPVGRFYFLDTSEDGSGSLRVLGDVVGALGLRLHFQNKKISCDYTKKESWIERYECLTRVPPEPH